MKWIPPIMAGLAAGLLAGGLAAGFPGRKPAVTSVRLPRPPAPPVTAVTPRNRPPAEAVTDAAARPPGIRNAIRLERALLRLDAATALRLITGKKVRVDGFSGVLLGWIAAGADPATALAASADGEPAGSSVMAGMLRRWLSVDPAGALAACRENDSWFPLLCREWALSNPAACAAALPADAPSFPANVLMNSWGALDPAAARTWAATHYPEGISDVFRGWTLTDPPAALTALLAEGREGPVPGNWQPADDWLGNAFSALTMANPEYAAGWLDGQAGPGRRDPLRAARFMLGSLAHADLNLCLALASRLPTPELRDAARVASAGQLFTSDPGQALLLLEKCETGAGQTDGLTYFIHAMGEMDPRAADPLLDRLAPEARRTTMENLLPDLEASTPDLARKWRALMERTGPG